MKKSIENLFEPLSSKPCNWTNQNLQRILWCLDCIIKTWNMSGQFCLLKTAEKCPQLLLFPWPATQQTSCPFCLLICSQNRCLHALDYLLSKFPHTSAYCAHKPILFNSYHTHQPIALINQYCRIDIHPLLLNLPMHMLRCRGRTN